jgi:hypothetical protein
MNNHEYAELTGRIEGLANFVLHLTAELEQQDMIDRKRFIRSTRRYARDRRIPGHPDRTQAVQRMLNGLLDTLETAYQARQ